MLATRVTAAHFEIRRSRLSMVRGFIKLDEIFVPVAKPLKVCTGPLKCQEKDGRTVAVPLAQLGENLPIPAVMVLSCGNACFNLGDKRPEIGCKICNE